MVVTVVGATGLIGGGVVRLLSESGLPVRAVTRGGSTIKSPMRAGRAT